MTTTLTGTRIPTERFASDEVRVEGHLKVTGQAKYTADFTMPGMLWAAFVPADVVHAKIVSIDTRAAKQLQGVHAVLTGRDIGEHFFGRRLCDWPVLAIDRVRFIGEFVAAVAAESPEIAEAAAALIEIEYEGLPTLFDPEAALEPDAIVLHEHPEQYKFMFPKRPQFAHKNIQGHGVVALGDVEAGFAEADRVFEYTFTTPRFLGGYIEPRATLVWIDEAGVAHFVSTNKSPFSLREQLAVTTGLPKEQIVIHPSFIGGEFGAKGLSVEEFPCYFLARATQRPVKYVRSYLDDIRSTSVRHASKVTVKVGVMHDGRIVAHSTYALFDGGAYAAAKVIPTILPGPELKQPYRIPNQRLERIAVYTNTIPGGFVRAPGDVQIAFATESTMDLIARELGIDPLELRLRNAVRDGDVDVEGHHFLAAGAVNVLEALKHDSRWETPLPPGRGRGVALAVRHIGGGKAGIALRLHADGTILMRSGVSDQGVGVFTLVQRVVAAELGLPESQIGAERGATNEIPQDPGVGGSRSTHLVGQAALDAVRTLRTTLEEHAGATLRDGTFAAADGTQTSWAAACAALVSEHGGSFDVVGNFEGESKHDNFAGYVVEVSVDRETGQCTVHDVWFCADVGTVINPLAHRGQIDGGFEMGFGHAFTEELVVEDGRIVNLSFADYKLPTHRDMPPFHVRLLETGVGPGPYGARAVGEINISTVGPALANAIQVACGARLTTLPVTAERVLDALHAR